MASLYADEDFPVPVSEELRHFGHDVRTVQDAGRAGQGIGDIDVLMDASAGQRAVLTHNHRDFARLHRQLCRTGQAYSRCPYRYAVYCKQVHPNYSSQQNLQTLKAKPGQICPRDSYPGINL